MVSGNRHAAGVAWRPGRAAGPGRVRVAGCDIRLVRLGGLPPWDQITARGAWCWLSVREASTTTLHYRGRTSMVPDGVYGEGLPLKRTVPFGLDRFLKSNDQGHV